MSKIDATDRALIAMLTENTGRGLCDSGDAYGRNWERNQHRDFMAEPATKLKIDTCGDRAEISVTHNVFHWLRERLTYSAKMTAKFRRFANKPENKDDGYLALMDAWAEKLEARGLYGEGSPMTVNTYNGEDLLSQTLQYLLFEIDDKEYVLLQIHGGCDVRGGYTAPRVFRVIESGAMFDNARATIWEEETRDANQTEMFTRPSFDNRYWSTDDGYHYYRDGACGLGALAQLETYEVSTDAIDRGAGKIVIDGDKIYGPISGGEMRASF